MSGGNGGPTDKIATGSTGRPAITESGTRYGRRRVLRLAGVAAAGALAGCAESGNGTDPDEGDNGGDSDDGDNGDDADDSEEDTGDDSEEDTGDDSGEDTGSEGDDNGTDDDNGGNDDTGDEPRLRDVFAFEQSYVMEFDTADGTGVWRFHEGDSYFRGEFEGETTEVYRIRTDSGLDTYTVSDGQCFKTSVDLEQADIFDPEEPEQDSEEYFASETTTVDGQEVYVFEVEEGTYYVSVDTGYPVRFETPDGDVVTFHSWGETDPISPPDGECQEL